MPPTIEHDGEHYTLEHVGRNFVRLAQRGTPGRSVRPDELTIEARRTVDAHCRATCGLSLDALCFDW